MMNANEWKRRAIAAEAERDDERRLCLASQNDLGNEQARVLFLENEALGIVARVAALEKAIRDALEMPMPPGKYTTSGPHVVFLPLAAVVGLRDALEPAA